MTVNIFRSLATRHRMERDAGAVAIIVALVVGTVLLGSAAFAVDLGNALAQRADLQGMADDAARAGAALLPDQDEAARAALANLCAQPANRTGWSYGGCGAATPTLPGAEIEFTDDEGNEPGVLVGGNSNFVATQITVRPPPIAIPFSFGQALGASGLTLTVTATAGIGTPTGLGVLPFFLVPGDFPADEVSTQGTPVAPKDRYQRGEAAGRFCINIGRSALYGNTACQPNRDQSPTSPDDNEQGELDVRRLNQSGSQVTTNIRQGVQPRLRDWSSWPLAGALREPVIGDNDDCGAAGDTVPDSSTSYTPDVSCVRVIRSLTSIFGLLNFTERNGFFGAGGRAFGRCPGGLTGSINAVAGVDTTPLLQIGSPLVDTAKGPVTGSGSLLQAITTSPPAPLPAAVPGWIRQSAFQCPQLALLPVLDATIPVNNGATPYPVLGFAYVWIQRVGLNRTPIVSDQGYFFSGSGRVIGLEGYVLPRRYLPDLVTTSPTVGPYLGPGWPRQVVLRHCPRIPIGIAPNTRLCTE